MQEAPESDVHDAMIMGIRFSHHGLSSHPCAHHESGPLSARSSGTSPRSIARISGETNCLQFCVFLPVACDDNTQIKSNQDASRSCSAVSASTTLEISPVSCMLKGSVSQSALPGQARGNDMQLMRRRGWHIFFIGKQFSELKSGFSKSGKKRSEICLIYKKTENGIY